MKKLSCIAALTLMLISTAAYALTLQEAKDKGLVGERTTGYIGAVKETPEVKALVKEINDKRKAAYMAISQENNQALEVVETLAAKKLYKKLAPGEYYESADGDWKQK